MRNSQCLSYPTLDHRVTDPISAGGGGGGGGGAQLQVRGCIEDNSKVIFRNFLMKTYVVTPH